MGGTTAVPSSSLWYIHKLIIPILNGFVWNLMVGYTYWIDNVFCIVPSIILFVLYIHIRIWKVGIVTAVNDKIWMYMKISIIYIYFSSCNKHNMIIDFEYHYSMITCYWATLLQECICCLFLQNAIVSCDVHPSFCVIAGESNEEADTWVCVTMNCM